MLLDFFFYKFRCSIILFTLHRIFCCMLKLVYYYLYGQNFVKGVDILSLMSTVDFGPQSEEQC